MLKACIFDLDGTLAYTLDSMASVANALLVELGFSALPVDNYRYYCGDGASELVKRCLKDAGDEQLAFREKMEELYRSRFNADPLYKVTVYPRIPETLQKLKEQGAFLGVCSNKPAPAAVKVVNALFGDTFDAVIGQSENVKRKPSPDMPLLLARQAGVLPEECLYIGDTGTDMQTGLAAGMHTVGAVWGFRGRRELEENHAEFLADSPEDIFRIFVQEGEQNVF